jgi:hypothetical protein
LKQGWRRHSTPVTPSTSGSRPTYLTEPSAESVALFDHDRDLRPEHDHERPEDEPTHTESTTCPPLDSVDADEALPSLDEEQVWDRDALAQAGDTVAANDPAARFLRILYLYLVACDRGASVCIAEPMFLVNEI